jgi:hypothetical protein
MTNSIFVEHKLLSINILVMIHVCLIEYKMCLHLKIQVNNFIWYT